MGLFLDLAWSSVPGSFKSDAGLSFPRGATSCPGTTEGVGDLREGNQLVVVIYVVIRWHINGVYFLIVSSLLVLPQFGYCKEGKEKKKHGMPGHYVALYDLCDFS